MKTLMDRLGSILLVGLLMATIFAPIAHLLRRMNEQEREAVELRAKTIEVMQRAHVVITRHDLQFEEQKQINELSLKLHGHAGDQAGDLAARIDLLEKATNIPPQRLPVTPLEKDADD